MVDRTEEPENIAAEEREELWLRAKQSGLPRRKFLSLLAAGGAVAVLAACGKALAPLATATAVPPTATVVPRPTATPVAVGAGDDMVGGIVLPPPNAKVVTTACDYCIVGCGYKAYTWPVGSSGGPTASENALGVDYPAPILSGKWISPNMQTVVEIDGRQQYVLVIPDGDTQVVNKGGDHSVRGGTLAQKLFRKDAQTRDRLTDPMIRVDGELVAVSWDDALDIGAGISKYVFETHGESAWGMKQFSYQYYENTYALTKLALAKVQTPAWVDHDKPTAGSDTPGLSDAGINAFSASYEDWEEAEVILVSGATLYETKSILFQEWVVPGGAKLIVVNPRKDFTAAYAEKNGGLYLQVVPGTDTLLHNSIARVILENGWEDEAFIRARTVNDAELEDESGWRRKEFGLTFSGYRDFILGDDRHTPENAASVTGVPVEKIRAAAEMMAAPLGGARPKTSMMLEKGNYWSHNYPNTASFAALGLLVGAGGRPGQMQSRAGGHQRGMIKAAGYPKDKSRDEYKGNKIELNVDRWVAEGNVRFMYVIGTTWLSAMCASQHLARLVGEMTGRPDSQVTAADVGTGTGVDVDGVLAVLKRRVDEGGMVIAHQEIYANVLTGFADIVLPAASWGEENFTRMQGERRLRLYSKIMDPPGQAKPDWWIVARVGKRMGFDGFDWQDSNDVFEEASERSVGTVHDYAALVTLARTQGRTGHELLGELGTTGIQCPIVLEGGELQPTTHLHQDGFGTSSGKAVFTRGDWDDVLPRQELFAPTGDELWVTNMRVNEHWQSQFDDKRIPYRWDRFPFNILEVNPQDADSRGIESGDRVSVANDAVLTQTGGTYSGKFEAVAYVTDAVPPGVTCSYFLFNQGRLDMAANSIAPGVTDPINNRYSYKLGKGTVTRIGESEFKHTVSFAPRNIA